MTFFVGAILVALLAIAPHCPLREPVKGAGIQVDLAGLCEC